MSSIPEERNAIIQKCIPKLITNLTGFSPNEENYKLCIQFAWSHIKYHRFMTVNVHEVKRDIAGICEKFKLNNFHEEEKEFRKLCERSLAHELSVDHYEKDVMYSIINMLVTLAYDPIGRLKEIKRKGLPVFMRIKKFEDLNAQDKTFMESLLEDNFKFTKNNDSGSELSEWSEDDECNKSTSESEKEEIPKSSKLITSSTLQPPKKPEVFTTIKLDYNKSKKWLEDNIQNCWWKPDEITHCVVNSSHPAANFFLEWQKHLTKKSLGFIKPQPTSLVSEYCLLREIFWMFSNPVNCKFFMLDKNEIFLRPNVTLPSTSPHSLQTFLKDIVNQLNIMNNLKNDLEKSSVDFEIGHTLENYYAVLKVFINEILDFILKQEKIVREQNESYTILRFQNEFRPHAKMLNMLWNIHSTSVLDSKNLPHIRTLHLLASLNNHIYEGTNREKRNLAITLLVACLETYLKIFDLWWTEARLHDLKKEFIVERISVEDFETVCPRLIEKCKEKSFYINDLVSNRISNDPLVSLMNHFATESSVSLEIVGKLDRVHEMKQINQKTSSLHEDFIERICQEIKLFASNDIDEAETENEEEMVENESSSINQKIVDDMREQMTLDNDELMGLIFESTFQNLTKTKQRKNDKSTSLKIYQMLNRATDSIFVPLENRIENNIKELLTKKIYFVEKFVIDIYLNEFSLDQRFKEVRQVFFLESNELMNYFNMKLFPQMENRESTWANPYLMTIALNDAIYRDRQHSTIFTVSVNKKLRQLSVLDAIDEIEIRFNMDDISENIFSIDAKKKYNEVFRFVLKIKWSLRILNCLLFPTFFKKRKPFAKLTMLDLVIKRLALTRFSMQQALNTIHNQIMVGLQGLSIQLDKNVLKSERINEIILLHNKFIDSCYHKTFLNAESKKTRGIIIEMLKLSKVIKDEWHNIETFYALDSVGKIDDSISLVKLNVNTIEIEKAFKACEIHLKDLLD